MEFKQGEADQLLADTGRRCCICGTLHKVQLHHIISKEDGGTDDIDNAITLCPNCHDEVHTRYSSGRTTRTYTINELKLHRQRTIEQVKNEGKWSPINELGKEDRELILFYAQCLDRPAFRTRFHQEMSFSAFDKAMEDTLIALNTGYWRTRDGALIERAKGKVQIVNPIWREKLNHITETIESIRQRFHEAVGFDRMLYQVRNAHFRDFDLEYLIEGRFRDDRGLSEWMDVQRQEVIETMNILLKEIGHQPMQGFRK